jgi:long-chain fatty acid transport protein
MRTLAVAPTVSYEAIPGLVLGAAPVFQRIEAKLGKAVNVTAILGAGGDAYSNLMGDDAMAMGGRFGVLWQATQRTRLGLAYHTEIRHELRGDATFSGNTPAALVNNNTLKNSPIRANVALPETASFGVQHRIAPDLTLAAEAAYTRWSKVSELRIRFETGRADDVTPLQWRDTYFLSAGAIWKAAEDWTLRTGVAFDKSPVPDAERTPRIPDQDRMWISIGAGYRLSEKIEFDAGYSRIFVRRAHINLVDGGAASEANRFRGNLTGSYDAGIDIVTFQARLKF